MVRIRPAVLRHRSRGNGPRVREDRRKVLAEFVEKLRGFSWYLVGREMPDLASLSDVPPSGGG